MPRVVLDAVGLLEQKPPGNLLGRQVGTGQRAGCKEDHVRLRREDLTRPRVEVRSYEDLCKDFRDLRCKLPVYDPAKRHDAAEGGGRVGGEGLSIRLAQIPSDRSSTRVGVFDNNRRRPTPFGEIGEGRPRGVYVVEVVEGELPSLQLLHPGEQMLLSASGVVGRLLVRVLTVTQRELTLVAYRQDLRKALVAWGSFFGGVPLWALPLWAPPLGPLGEPPGDGFVIPGGPAKGFEGEPPPRFEGDLAELKFRGNLFVEGG